MTVARIVTLLLVLVAGQVLAQDSRPAAKDVVPTAGSIYYYWYRHPEEHFRNPDGTDGLTQHFAEPKKVDYRSAAWHQEQLDWMMEAELDFVLPVYWPGAAFSDPGLKALVEAWKTIRDAGGAPPRIGMFYDTTPYLAPRGDEGRRLDLRRGKDVETFAAAIVRFYRALPPEAWYELDGYPVVMFYGSFGAPHDREVLDHVAALFKRDLGKKPFFIVEESWRSRTWARYRWGAALNGPSGDTVVRTLGPGYDDTAVPGRGTPIRDREEARFYRWSWSEVLRSAATIVVIETWNEFHEGSGIAPCNEYGRTYVDLTRRYVKRLKRRLLPDEKNPVRLTYPDPRPRPDTGWWTAREDVARAAFQPTRSGSRLGDGIRLVAVPDGPYRQETLAGRTWLTTPAVGAGATYLYFGIADEFAHRDVGAFEVEIEFVDGGRGAIRLQYDAWDLKAPLKGTYKSAPEHRRSGTTKRRHLVYTLPDARFGNRQNGGSDFRLLIKGDPASIGSVSVRRTDTRVSRPTLDLR